MKIFSNDQIKDIVRYTIEHDGVSELELVQRAGQGIAREIAKRWSPDKRMVVFAGWGNNGADALAASHELMRQGYDPEIILLNIGGSRLSTECAECRDLLLEEFPNAKLDEIVQSFVPPELDSHCLVIDGLFGSGLNRTLPSSLSMIIQGISDSKATVVSIDIPSGLFAEWNANSINRNIIHATLTIAIEFPRLAFFIDDNAELVGEWITISIGLNKDAIRNTPYTYYLITSRNVRSVLRKREPQYTKAQYGSALICAGSYGMLGAAILATKGCLRSGAGKVTCYGPKCGFFPLQIAVPEAMYESDHDNTFITDITLHHDYQAIAIGPGIGTSDRTISALEHFLHVSNANGRPLVLDADALNCISIKQLMLNYLPVLSVLTPHAGEFDRIFGAQPSAEARLRKAIEMAAYYNVIILLKGRYTAVVRPDGKVHINSSGSPALATGGSGDVLTGVISGLMAQGYPPETAAMLGAFIHGVAGQISMEEHGDYGTTSMDIANNIGRAIKRIMNPE